MRDKCVVCGGARAKVVFTEFDVDILRCRDCGHVFSSYAGWEAHGYEISEPAVSFARDRLGLANVSLGLVQESDFPEKHFDVLTLWDVIEHIPDPDPLLSYLSHVLADDGLLFIHTGNASIQVPKAKLKRLIKRMRQGVHYLEAKDHINIYSMSTMRRVLTRNGFDSVRFTHLHPVQSVAGGRNPAAKFAKNAWFNLAKALSALTAGRVNLDNLHVVARKRVAR